MVSKIEFFGVNIRNELLKFLLLKEIIHWGKVKNSTIRKNNEKLVEF